MRAGNFNSQIVLECLSMFAPAVAMLVSVFDGTYLHYVVPRTKPFLLFAAAVLFCWTAAGLSRVRQPRYRHRAAHALVLAIPALLLLRSSAPLAVSDFSFASSLGDPASEFFEESLRGLPESEKFAFDKWSAVASRPPFEPTMEGGAIIVRSEDFYPLVALLHSDADRYEGVPIRIEGFVFRESVELEENQFILARLLMWCCAADVAPFGPVCEYEGASTLEEGTWVALEGTVRVGEYEGEKEPRIVVSGIETGLEPERDYIYP